MRLLIWREKMKKFSKSLLAGVTMLSLAACSGSGTAAGSSAAASGSASEVETYMSDTKAAEIKLADTKNLVEVTNYELQSMDYVTTAMTEDHWYNADMVDGLLENDQKGNLVPCIAESYEVSDDGLKWTFHLRKGAKWVTNTGEEYDDVKAEDFVTGVRHGAEFQSGTGWLLEGVLVGYEEYFYGENYSDEEWDKVGIKALDDYTLEFTLTAPAPYFPSMTTYAVLYPINKTFLEGKGSGCKLGAPAMDSCEFGQVAPDSILYNGGFILQSNDVKSSTVLKKNQAYWDAEHIYLDSIKYIYDDGSDPYSVIRGFEAGTYAASALSPLWENFSAYITKYDGFVTDSMPDSSTFGVVFNMNRQIFNESNYCANNPDANVNTHNAILNDNFRKALRAAYDVKAYNMVSSPESIALSIIRNINTQYNIVHTSDGTSYIDLVNEVYNQNTETPADLTNGQYAWLNKEAALAYIEAAKAEGIEFPVHLDMLVDETSKARSDRGRSMKESIEANTDGQIIIELVMRDSDTVTNIAYRNQDPATMDYDISTFTGWGPDYADPKTFVDIYSPVSGYYMKAMGLETGPLDTAPDADIKEAVGLVEYERLYREADAITDDMDARYRAFAAADAYLVERAFYIPTSTNTVSVRVSHAVPFSRVYSSYGMSDYKHKGLQLQEDLVTTADYNAAKEAWEKGE